MSLRLKRNSSQLMPESDIWQQMIPYVEKLLLTPQGVGLVAIGAGILLRFTHGNKHYKLKPGVTIQGNVVPGTPPEAWVETGDGLDQVVFTVPQASVQAYLSTLAAGFASPTLGILGIFGIHLGQQTPKDDGTIDITLSDLLILMGAGVFLGSALGSVIPKI